MGMNIKIFKALSLSIALGMLTQGAHAASMKKTVKPVPVPLTFEKQLSPIEKALSQQKRDRISKKTPLENDQIKSLTSLKYAPSQNFLAEQHQRFSRFVQLIFPQHNS